MKDEIVEDMAPQTETDDSWSFGQIWNSSIEKAEIREYEPRDYMWASELGKLQTDVYLMMKGVKPSNYPNARSYRKFEAGNLWEWIVKLILIRAGILISTQKKIKVAYPGMIEVSGKLDFFAGGIVDKEKAKQEIEALMLPEKTQKSITDVVEHLATRYPEGLRKKVLEIKSVSSHMMNALEITKTPLDIHALQAFHYTKDDEIDRADVVYICRDDCRIMEFPILANNTKYEAMYRKYIEEITHYYRNDIEPPKAPPVTFNENLGKFELNRLIGWSSYLTLNYGLEDQLAFDEKYGGIPASWNRVLKRKKEGKPMTKNNDEKIAEMTEQGWDFEQCADKFILTNTEEDDSGDTD